MNKFNINFGLFISFGLAIIFLASCNKDETLKVDFPMISTVEISEMMYNQVTVSGHIISDGGDSIVEQGVCWNTLPNPTIANYSKKNSDELAADFSVDIPELNSNLKYYVRSYAINKKGISYGENLTFTLWLNHPEDPVKDIDNNSYTTVRIGDQIWMTENLKVTHYQNGDPITNITMQDDEDWLKTRKGAFCSYNDDGEQAEKFGYLYNGYAIFDERNICPEGWHMPSREELETLINYLGGHYEAGYLLKNRSGWDVLDPNTNLSGFSALPGGARVASHYDDDANGKTNYCEANISGFFASGERSESVYDTNVNRMWYVRIVDNGSNVFLIDKITLMTGQSIRCIKD
ncbi:fibrobacter succinogenes major paralogous domain-containing protein [Carboxylicivirga sp. M1479]|uniref:fibrobacter succinogenes major paralogous domain-containing protein n=1 Tax=Carboxylicivirga sp. M1479 TaxID=2594476 RepID=UPI001178231F|nr:fibrobacter succinogenes major paralogous domain-containing protein [Carboxylicivirga sp. M1479]TRX62822.1 hypothetical protein FNN09_19505 [Carboxylicivirga sp. M1479]